eukprot:TRINITY_DN1063_c0_g1_i1.p1 TRINITY_DN1063_c0_g1~~TRINITY_DN1063_c0_g1_i1.p1  ORF type:complete len:583 (+),score=158.91 TRINITY_DN1063_c0_g1_i1:78-1826(+)
MADGAVPTPAVLAEAGVELAELQAFLDPVDAVSRHRFVDWFPKQLWRGVMGRGPLRGAHNPSAMLEKRMETANGGPLLPPLEWYCRHNALGGAEEALLRRQPPQVLRKVLELGNVHTAACPAQVIAWRVDSARDAVALESFLRENQLFGEARRLLRQQKPAVVRRIVEQGSVLMSDNPLQVVQQRVAAAVEAMRVEAAPPPQHPRPSLGHATTTLRVRDDPFSRLPPPGSAKLGQRAAALAAKGDNPYADAFTTPRDAQATPARASQSGGSDAIFSSSTTATTTTPHKTPTPPLPLAQEPSPAGGATASSSSTVPSSELSLAQHRLSLSASSSDPSQASASLVSKAEKEWAAKGGDASGCLRPGAAAAAAAAAGPERKAVAFGQVTVAYISQNSSTPSDAAPADADPPRDCHVAAEGTPEVGSREWVDVDAKDGAAGAAQGGKKKPEGAPARLVCVPSAAAPPAPPPDSASDEYRQRMRLHRLQALRSAPVKDGVVALEGKTAVDVLDTAARWREGAKRPRGTPDAGGAPAKRPCTAASMYKALYKKAGQKKSKAGGQPGASGDPLPSYLPPPLPPSTRFPS